MQKKNKLKQEKASMAVYVSIVLLSFLLILVGIYMTSMSARKSQLKTTTKIKEAYEIKLPDTTVPWATITVNTDAMFENGSTTVTVKQEDNETLDLSKCKYVYNTTSSSIGTDTSKYTGGSLSQENSTLTLNFATAGTYYLHVLTVDAGNNATETISSPISVVSKSAINYATANSTSNPYSTFVAPADGVYQLQVWGAQGGYRSSATYGGKGGYSTGNITLTKGDELYVYVGGSGNSVTSATSSVYAGGYNGGGYRYGYKGGGGATDIRLTSGAWNNSASLLSRVIVAGGGGSDGQNSKNGMYGGGTTGGSASQSYGSYGAGGKANTTGCGTVASSQYTTNSSSNYPGGFGFGGFGIYRSSGYGGAGGGGWYGGDGAYPDGSQDDDRGGGGGSGWIWTSSTASNKPSGYSVATKYYLASASTTAGNASFTTTSGSGTETGHSGDGYAKITPISVSGKSSTTTSKGE